MSLPALYAWINQIPDQPQMIIEGIKLLGIKEYPGTSNNNPTIMAMAKDLGLPPSIYPNDETAWCAMVHSWLCWKTKKPLPGIGSGVDVLRARNFAKWGNESKIPMFGDTCVFTRPSGHHVGFYVAEDITHYHIMGGNQRNSYSILRLEKGRLLACRRYYSINAPASVKPIRVAPSGEISLNES